MRFRPPEVQAAGRTRLRSLSAWPCVIQPDAMASMTIRARLTRMVEAHLEGIINAVVLKATNALAESINGRIQNVKRMAHGFRNIERFQRAIYFHLGGLDLYPASPTHTKP